CVPFDPNHRRRALVCSRHDQHFAGVIEQYYRFLPGAGSCMKSDNSQMADIVEYGRGTEVGRLPSGTPVADAESVRVPGVYRVGGQAAEHSAKRIGLREFGNLQTGKDSGADLTQCEIRQSYVTDGKPR